MQIIIEKKINNIQIVNTTTVIPDTNNTAQKITMVTAIGKVQNNSIDNRCEIIVSNSMDGINVEKISTTYSTNIQVTETVDEIMELKNSNSIIVNNYPIEQLIPFFEGLTNKAEQVIPTKIEQLGINFTTNDTDAGYVESLRIPTMLGSAITGMASANGIEVENIVTTGIVGIGLYIYNMASEVVLDVTLPEI